MTMPHLMNCPHSDSGLCRECSATLLSSAVAEIKRMSHYDGIVWSTVSSPCPGEIIWWEVYQKCGERLLLIHGKPPSGVSMLHVLHLAEAFPDSCRECAGMIADGRIEPDGRVTVHMTSTGPLRLFETPLNEKCDECRKSDAAQSLREARRVCRNDVQFFSVLTELFPEILLASKSPSDTET